MCLAKICFDRGGKAIHTKAGATIQRFFIGQEPCRRLLAGVSYRVYP